MRYDTVYDTYNSVYVRVHYHIFDLKLTLNTRFVSVCVWGMGDGVELCVGGGGRWNVPAK